MSPQTLYADHHGVSIAYQVTGSGPIDLLTLFGWMTQVEHVWEEPELRRFLERIGQFARVITYDRRGTGLSGGAPDRFGVEDEIDDAVAVLDAAGSSRAALFSYGAGGPLAAHLAARRPDRVGALIMYASIVRSTAAPGYEWTHTDAQRREFIDATIADWGSSIDLSTLAPSRAGDERFHGWMTRLQRLSGSPATMRAALERQTGVDARQELPAIGAPALVLHRQGDQAIDMRHSEFVAGAIPGARLQVLPGADSLPWLGEPEPLLDACVEFLTGRRAAPVPERTLLTVMFTDIVDATGHARRLGDRRWSDLLEAHDGAVRRELEAGGGREVKTIGDSFLAVFEGPPSRALRCAGRVVRAVQELGVELRVGMHTGECELIGEDVGGLAVHIASRVQHLAGPGEVLVSGTTFGTVVGAGFDFVDRGRHELKGIGGEWPLFRLELAPERPGDQHAGDSPEPVVHPAGEVP
jgi:class 3 adenylate cyclase